MKEFVVTNAIEKESGSFSRAVDALERSLWDALDVARLGRMKIRNDQIQQMCTLWVASKLDGLDCLSKACRAYFEVLYIVDNRHLPLKRY